MRELARDVVCLVPVTEEDARVGRLLQQSPTPVLLVVNKVDDDRREIDVWDFARLGLGAPWPV